MPGFGVPLGLIFGLAAASAVIVLMGGSMAMRARHRPVVSGREEMVGASGVVLAIGEGGTWVQVHGERWRVESAVRLVPGQRVRVEAVRGLTLQVHPEPDTINQGDST